MPMIYPARQTLYLTPKSSDDMS